MAGVGSSGSGASIPSHPDNPDLRVVSWLGLVFSLLRLLRRFALGSSSWLTGAET